MYFNNDKRTTRGGQQTAGGFDLWRYIVDDLWTGNLQNGWKKNPKIRVRYDSYGCCS